MTADRSLTGAARPTVLVDARVLRSSGLGRYLREVLRPLLTDPRFGRIVLLGDTADLRAFVTECGGDARTNLVAYPTGVYDPRVQAAWLGLRRRHPAADVSFFPHYDVPLLAMPRRSVVTIHDLIHFRVPELFPAAKRLAGAVLLSRAAHGAGRIITVSQATARDLVARHPHAAAKIEVIPNGVSSAFQPAAAEGAASPQSVTEVSSLQPYLLCVGNRKPHKNLVRAVEALAELRRGDPGLRLVVAGPASAAWADVLRRAEDLGVRGAIVDLGLVEDTMLRELYARCEALLFPSLYEGFGLPALEAMAAGACVVASDRSSVPEVVGDGGILVDPEAPGEMAGAVARLRSDPELRARLSARAIERAAGYSWARSARQTLDLLYEEAMQV